MTDLDRTHDLARRSWVISANKVTADFPIQNLPFCVFLRDAAPPRVGVAIGTDVLDLAAVLELGLLSPEAAAPVAACASGRLNDLMSASKSTQVLLRQELSDLLLNGNEVAARHAETLLIAAKDVAFQLPASIGGFSDFFSSFGHAERTGRLNRPDNPVTPNFRYMPIAYNGRASSVRLSGEDVRRPHGQWRDEDDRIVFAPSRALDFELELGAFVGRGNPLGTPLLIGSAIEHVFGYCLLNDWSARDFQRWESFPLGPFLSKSLSTTISPFIVTSQALLPFRTTAAMRPEGDPAPLPHLYSAHDQQYGGLDLALEAFISTPTMRQEGRPPIPITRTNFKHMYWTIAQMLTHHTSNGCNLNPGDLIGSGTTSGPTNESRACLLEITTGRDPIVLPNGETRRWLEDGDEVVFRARAQRPGFVSIGFGECRACVAPAHTYG